MTEKEKLVKWLDKLVKHYKDSAKIARFDESIETCVPYVDGVHIYKGLNHIADVLGVKLTRRDREDAEYPLELSFKYKDVKFYQIYEENV